MLSRLKGIETQVDRQDRLDDRDALDMLSRLKGIETVFNNLVFDFEELFSLDMLSRLKGIETNII